MNTNECVAYKHDGVVYQFPYHSDLDLLDNDIFVTYRKSPTNRRIACDLLTFKTKEQAEEAFNSLDKQLSAIEKRLYPNKI